MHNTNYRFGCSAHLTRITARAAMLLALGLVGGAFVPDAVPVASAQELSASEILRRADEVRNPSDSFFLRVRVVSSDRPNEPSEFEVSLLGNDKTLVRTVKPSRDRGRNLLMRDTQMWAYIPNLKRAVRVSLSQKLVGQAANGDISRMRWSGDYDARIEKQDDKHWTLFLTGKKEGFFPPVSAEYLSVAGKPLKKAQFTGYKDMLRRQRPTEIRIQDAVRPDDQSVLKVLQMEERKFPASLFVPENLG
jgi:hypothetical protein